MILRRISWKAAKSYSGQLTRPLQQVPKETFLTTEHQERYVPPGADMVFVIRHAERLDRQEPSWSALAKRPQDTPLSALGKKQAERLGKWLYGRLPVHAPLAIFCSPFIRCVQTADAVASQLEGLQHAGLHASSATKICIEPGLCEDMTYMNQLKQQEPWILNAADLVCASPRVDLSYKPLRVVTHERGPVYPGGCVETTPGGTLERCNTIALELANHPLVRPNGTALIITHGNPSTHMVKSLCPRPGGIHLPDYADIKAGNYDGPPLQYTACTALKKKKKVGGDEGGAGGDEWDLAPGFKVFSNEHDPRLKTNRKIKKLKVTRYVTAHGHGDAPGTREMRDFQVAAEVLKDAEAGTAVTVPHPDTGDALTFTLPAEFKSGDRMRIRHIASAFSGAKGVEEPGVHGAAKTVPTRKGIKIGDVDATEKTKAAYAETILVKSA